VHRIGRGSVFIENLSISLLGGIQPEPIREIAANATDDGLLQRILPIMLRPAVEGYDEAESLAASEYAQLVGRLRQLNETVLVFDEAAQAYRQDLERRHLKLQTCFDGINRKLAAHIGKYNGIFPQLCIIWHCAEHAVMGTVPAVVSIDTAKRAGAFLHGFLLRHAVAFYAEVLGLSNDHDSLVAVAGYILTHKKARITNRDVMQGDKAMRRLTAKQREAVFEQLEALGWLDRTAGPRANAPPHWIVNPAVHEKFAGKAKEEAERRSNAREMLAEIFGRRA
jgi:hypothetical protein